MIRQLIEKKKGHAMSLTLLITMFVTSIVLLVSILVNREIKRNTDHVNFENLTNIANVTFEQVTKNFTPQKDVSLQQLIEQNSKNYTCKSISEVEFDCVIKAEIENITASPIEQKFTVRDINSITDFKLSENDELSIKPETQTDFLASTMEISTSNQLKLLISINYSKINGDTGLEEIVSEPLLKRVSEKNYISSSNVNGKTYLQIDFETFASDFSAVSVENLTFRVEKNFQNSERISISTSPANGIGLQARIINFKLFETDNQNSPIIDLRKQLLLVK